MSDTVSGDPIEIYLALDEAQGEEAIRAAAAKKHHRARHGLGVV